MRVGAREKVRIGLAALAQSVEKSAAGVGKAGHFGELVAGLTGGVVDGLAQHFHLRGAFHAVKMRVSAGNEHAQRRPCDFVFQACRQKVPVQVVHTDEGDVVGEGEGFGKGHAYQQTAHEARAAGDGDAVDAFPRIRAEVGLGEEAVEERTDEACVLA